MKKGSPSVQRVRPVAHWVVRDGVNYYNVPSTIRTSFNSGKTYLVHAIIIYYEKS